MLTLSQYFQYWERFALIKLQYQIMTDYALNAVYHRRKKR